MPGTTLAAATAIAVALLTGLTQSGAQASSGVTGARWFQSPSGNIQCELDYRRAGVPNVADCQTFTPARSAQLTTSGALRICTGVGCVGNGPDNETTLAYGSSISLGPFRCSSRTTGVTCTIRSGAGFTIARAGVTPTSAGEAIEHTHGQDRTMGSRALIAHGS